MNRYVVFGGVANIGAGQVLELSGEQIKSRAHNLQLPEGYEVAAKDSRSKAPVAKPALVTARAPLQFIVGEEFGMADLPAHLIGIVKPIGEVRSETDAMAADKALLIEDPKAHAAKTKAARKAAAEAKAAKKAGKSA
jgi:hypothetical protein